MSLRNPKLFLFGAVLIFGLGLVAVLALIQPQPVNVANRMTISAGCHRILESPFDVANPRGKGLGTTLVPPNPTKGLICRYTDFNDVRLYTSVALTPPQSALIASTLDQIHSTPPERGEFYYGCGGPNQSYDFFIFGYSSRRDVDVLYKPYGGHDSCPGLTNGPRSLTGEIDTALLHTYVEAFAGPLPMATCGPGMTVYGRPAPCPSGAWLPFGSLKHVTIPNVVGMTMLAAQSKLYFVRVFAQPWPAPNSKAPKNQIVAQTPPPGRWCSSNRRSASSCPACDETSWSDGQANSYTTVTVTVTCCTPAAIGT